METYVFSNVLAVVLGKLLSRWMARELYIEYKIRQKNELPVISKRFANVAAYCVADMQKQLKAFRF